MFGMNLEEAAGIPESLRIKHIHCCFLGARNPPMKDFREQPIKYIPTNGEQ